MKATNKIRLFMRTDVKLKVVFLLISFICCLIFLLFMIQLREYLLLTKDLEAFHTELAHVKGVVAAQEKEQEKLVEINKNISELEILFHLEMRDGTPLVLLGQLSADLGVQVITLTPEEMATHYQIIEIPLVLVVRGDYQDILTLCQELEDNVLHNFTLIRYVKLIGYSDSSFLTRKQTSGFLGFTNNVAEEFKSNTEQEPQASNMVDAELEISIFMSATPQAKSDFDWEKSSQSSVFYHPIPELSTTPEFSIMFKSPTTPTPDPSANFESPTSSDFSSTPEPELLTTPQLPTVPDPATTSESSTTEGESQP